MKEDLMHYMHVAPLFIIVILSIANLVFKTKKFYSYLRKYHIGLQLLLVSMGVMSGAISHSHYEILGCNLCLVYSAILAWSAIRLLFRINNVSKCQVS
jgi:uncharacterized membrane protein